ncbi:MAG TPA: maltokinase [Mycobacteriales bacterium]|nr:maltokinase [Mycobacteriales bacterium]
MDDALRDWLPSQRWYGGKGKEVRSVRLVHEERLPVDGADVRHTLLEVTDADGATDTYQLLLGHADGELEPRLEPGLVGEVAGRQVYDAVHSLEAPAALLDLMAAGRSLSRLHASSTAELDTSLPPRVMGAEQSNTSVVFGDAYILKLFRRVQPGLNPDLEVTRALAEAGSPHVAAPLGWLEADVAGERTTLAMLQVFERSSSEGWAMATASVRDLFAEGDLHADEVGGDFAAESERLGAATAAVHALLAQVLPSGTAGADESRATAQQLVERFERALEVVPDLAPHADAVRALYARVGERTEPVPVQRVHGDYHLGQVLRTQNGWLLLDFEGEPARPLAERTALMSPLRDVAGMLRSYDYAARHLLAERSGVGAGSPQLAYRADEWAQRNRAAFCDGYAAAAGTDPREEAALLRAFELDKAVYEVVYEARNRPSWLAIPLGSIERLLSDPPTNPDGDPQ